MMNRFRRPSLAAWFCFLATFITLLGLGAWQLERLSWKQSLLAQVSEGMRADPYKGLPDDNRSMLFRKASIYGTFDDTEFHVTPRYFNDKLGYHVFVPFKLHDSGTYVMVNRGWVPTDKKDPASRPASRAPKGKVALIVQIREGAERGYFTPDSQPEKNIWFGRDIDRMASHASLTALPYSVDVIGEQDASVLPVPMSGEVKLRNDHLQYAITWFLIALGALIVFAVFHRKDKGEA